MDPKVEEQPCVTNKPELPPEYLQRLVRMQTFLDAAEIVEAHRELCGDDAILRVFAKGLAHKLRCEALRGQRA